MSASIFNGTAVKILKNVLRFKSGNVITTQSTIDPTVTPTDGIPGDVLITDGGNIYVKADAGVTLSWGQLDTSGGTKADVSLSNLVSTAVGTDLNPAVDNTVNCGNPSFRWAEVWGNFVSAVTSLTLRDTSGNPKIGFSERTVNSSLGPFIVGPAVPGTYTHFGITGRNNNNNDAVATEDITINTGAKTAGTGNSGNILVRTGPSAGGTRGKAKYQDGTEGTVGHVLTSVDSAGTVRWSAPSSAAGVVSAFARSTNGPAYSSGAALLFHPDSVENDPSGIYNTGTGLWTIPAGVVGTINGTFHVAVTDSFSAFSGHATSYIQIKKNGGAYTSNAPTGYQFSSENAGFNGTAAISGVAGDTFEISVVLYGISGNLLGNGVYNWAQLVLYR